jgi:hypothetical protein
MMFLSLVLSIIVLGKKIEHDPEEEPQVLNFDENKG